MVEKITLTTVVGLVTTCSGEEFSDWAPSSPVLPSAPLSSFPSATNNDIQVLNYQNKMYMYILMWV